MRLLAALALLLTAFGLILAGQPYNSNAAAAPSAKDEGPTSQEVRDETIALGDDNAQVRTFGLWGSAALSQLYLPMRMKTPDASATMYSRKMAGPRFKPNPNRPSIIK